MIITAYNGKPMKGVYVDADRLREWNNGWLPQVVDYSVPIGVIGYNVICRANQCDNAECPLTCKRHILTYFLMYHAEGSNTPILFDCPVRFTRDG